LIAFERKTIENQYSAILILIIIQFNLTSKKTMKLGLFNAFLHETKESGKKKHRSVP